MSNYSKNTIKVLYEIIDNDKEIILFCKLCQKKVDTYRKVRYHFSTIHELTPNQFSRISKIGRLLGK
jgi:hypothetical protein